MSALGTALLGSAILGGPSQTLQVAWGADLTDITGTTWVWTDVTTYARTSPGFSWRLGRNDESSKANPAELTAVLDNTAELFSIGGRSPNYPNVKRNVPVRLLIDPGDAIGGRVAFLGFATGWTPSWDSLDGTIPVVTLTASGTLRRLGQGAEPVISPVKRYITALESVVAYWPCEVGKHASDIPNLFGGGNITWAGTADLASCTDYAASLDLPKTNSSGLFRAQVSPYTVPVTNTQSVRMLFTLPPTSSAPANNSVLVSLIMTGGSTSRIDLIYGTGSTLTFKAYDRSGAVIFTDGPTTFSIDGTPGMISMEMAQSGGLVFGALKFLGLGSTSYGFDAGSSGSGTLGIVSEVWIDAYQTVTGVGFGHLAVLTTGSAVDPLDDGYLQINAYTGEGITNGRLARVCGENAIDLALYGGTADSATFNDYAGPQSIDTVLNIIHDCEDVERGVLWDGLTPGLAYTTRRRHENATAALTVNAAALQLAAPFDPTDDDQRTRNRWTVSRKNGAEFTVGDTTGRLGTGAGGIGVYSDSKTINSYKDRAARDLADWLVHAGTIPGYRYPAITIDLVANPELRAGVLDLFIGARVDVTNLGTALTAAANETVSLTVEGISHTLTADTWEAKLSCSPFEVWRVDVLATDTGDTGEFIARPDTDGSTLTTAYSAGATSIVVDTPTGPLWTTAADDYPLNLDVGGVEVTASACSSPGGTDPSVRSRATWVNDTPSTTHTPTLPGTIVAGDKLLVAFTNDVASVFASTSSTGWSTLITRSQGTASTVQLGQTTAGGSTSSSSANKTVVSKFTAASTGTVTAGHARLNVDTGTAPNVSMVVYADSAGVPGSLLGQSSTLTVSNTTLALTDFTWASGPSITSGTDYWIGFTWPDPGTNNISWGRAGTAAASSQNSSNAANPFGAATTLTGPIDAYVDVTTSATNHTSTVFTKVATGSDTLIVNLTAAQEATAVSLAIADAGAIEATGNDGASSVTVACPAITPAAGTTNYLAVEVIATDSSATTSETVSAVPSGYTNLQSQNPGNTSSAATFTMEQTYAATTTITPGNATLGTAEQWIAFTIAIAKLAVSSTQQTFTVAALPVARPSGAAVAVWTPPALGL